MTGHRCRLWLLTLLLAGCEGSGYVIDPFAVSVDFSQGVPVLLGCAPELADCNGGLTVVIDTGTPITVIDPGLDAGTPITRRFTSLDLKSTTPQGVVTRARFTGFTTFVQPLGPLGLEGVSIVDPGVVLGGDRLGNLAMRMSPASGKLFFFPNIAGTNDVLARECSAVIPSTRLGGGEYTFEGAQLSYPATRQVVGTCLNLDRNPLATDPTPHRPRGNGADAQLVVSTGLPVTVLSRSAWLRACTVNRDSAASDPNHDDAACAETTGTLHLPGSMPGTSISVALGKIAWLGLSSDEVRTQRGACKEMWASRMMDAGGCNQAEKDGGVCLCAQGSSNNPCKAGASSELAGPIQVAILEDDDPVLQALRDELRPGVADIDGFLGMNAFMPFVTDFDSPNSRIILRCEDPASTTCFARPRLQSFSVRRALLGCLGRQQFDPTPPGEIPND